MTRHMCSISALLFCAAVAGPASAAMFSFTGTQGDREATVTIDVGPSNTLVVTLRNSALTDVLAPIDVLTGVYFDSITPLTLTPVSAVLASGSVVLFDSQPVNGVVGGEWAYRGNLTGQGAPGNTRYGISSTGLGLFGAASFPGPDLDPPAAVGGLEYGLTSAGDNSATGNTPVTGSVPLIKSGVVFTFSGVPANFDPAASIRNVWFQYGTSLTEPSFAPTPGAVALAGFAGLVGLRRRRA